MNPLKEDLLRCVQPCALAHCCGGTLREVEEAMQCCACGHSYPVIQGVPVLKQAGWENRESWYAEANIHYSEFYSRRSRTVDLESEYLKVERELMVQLVKQHQIIGPCLEVGCGTGIFAATTPDYIGLDYTIENLFAAGFSDYARLCGDARWLPFGDSTINCIFSFNTLEHVPQVDLAFAEMTRVLAPGGLLVLKPAWHSARYITDLVELRTYNKLNPRGKLMKLLLPALKSKAYKFLTRIPWRLWRRATAVHPCKLRWTTLHPDPAELWRGGDVDAVASLDSHEAILYFQSRGYQCLSHRGTRRQLFAGHDVIVFRKFSHFTSN